MKKAAIIVKVEEPTEWVSPLVAVRKMNELLQVCMDPREVNKNIFREHYPIPIHEDIESGLSGAEVCLRLDANSGFYEVPLDEATPRMCTFATPFGRYRFLRLLFGISSASEVFQKTLYEIFEGVPRARVYVKDALVLGGGRQSSTQRTFARRSRKGRASRADL